MEITADTAIGIQVSDPSGIAVVVVFAEYPGAGTIDAVWTGSAFASEYGTSTVDLTPVSGITFSGSFSLERVGGWPEGTIRLRVVTVDLAGNLSTTTNLYSVPSTADDPIVAAPGAETDGTGYALQPREQTYAAEFPAYFMAQYFQWPDLTALLEGLLETGQEIETAILELRNQFNPLTASGAFLTALGEDVGEERGGRSDDEFRPAVLARIAINRSSGTWDELLRLARVLTGSTDDPIVASDVGGSQGAQAQIEITHPYIDPDTNSQVYDPALVNEQLDRMRPAGVRLFFEYATNEDAFTLGDPAVVLFGTWIPQTSTTLGLSSLTATSIGGHLAGVFDHA